MGTSSLKRSEISWLRIIATFAIVLLHTGSAIADNRTNYSCSTNQLYFFECVRNTMQWGVPVFYMISGALLLSSKRTVTLKTVSIYALRMTAVLFLFGVPFAMMEILFANRQISVELLFTAVLYVLEGKSWSHLWYLYSIIGIYLILPFLKCFTENCERKVMEYLLVVLFVFTNCLPIISKLMDLNIAINIPINSAIFYVLLGKYLDDYYGDFFADRKKAILLFGFASGLVLLLTRYTLGYSATFIYNSSPPVTLQAIAIFSWGLQWRQAPRNLWHIDRLCFGVYLVHPLLINILYKVLKISPIYFQHYRIATLGFFCLFAAGGFAISCGMYCIKPIRKLLFK